MLLRAFKLLSSSTDISTSNVKKNLTKYTFYACVFFPKLV